MKDVDTFFIYSSAGHKSICMSVCQSVWNSGC